MKMDASPVSAPIGQHGKNQKQQQINEGAERNEGDDDETFKKMIAKRMIGKIPQPPETPEGYNSNHSKKSGRNFRYDYDYDYDYNYDRELEQLVPPWETPASTQPPRYNGQWTPANVGGNDNRSQSQYFFQRNNSLREDIHRANANYANHSNPAPIIPTTPTLPPPPPPPTPTPTYLPAYPTSALTPSSKHAATAVTTPSSTSAATPRVSFGTHDQIFQWDEQLDLLKHVDEEFFSVAHFLLDVVGIWDEGNRIHGNGNGNDNENGGGVAKEGENYYFVNEDDFQWSDDANNSGIWWDGDDGSRGAGGHGVAGGIGGLGKKGSKLLTWLSIFNCSQPVSGGSLTEDDYNHNKSSFGLDDGDWSLNSDEKKNRAKKYKLTEKLVRDFQAAVDFRMETISSKVRLGEEESDLVKRTKEIARKVKAYGLPKREKTEEDDPESNRGIVTVGGSYDKSEPSLQPERKRQQDSCYIPKLADFDDEDDDDEGKRDENAKPDSIKRKSELLKAKHPSSPIDPYAKNTTSSDTKPKLSSHHVSKASCLFQPFFRSKSSTPSAEECQKRLHQIKHEIENVQKMHNTTKNEAVQAACQMRIIKLKDEMRFCQIVKEWHKIRSMMESSAVEVVKVACKERLKQLVLELKTLDLDDDEVEEPTVVETKKEEPPSGKAEKTEEEEQGKKEVQEEKENEQWYQRVLQYVQPINVGGNNRGWDSSMCPIRYDEETLAFECRENEGDYQEQRNIEYEKNAHKQGNDTSSTDYRLHQIECSEQSSKPIEQISFRTSDRVQSQFHMPSLQSGSFMYRQGMSTTKHDYSGSNSSGKTAAGKTTTRENDTIPPQQQNNDTQQNKEQSLYLDHRELHNTTFDHHVHQGTPSFESFRNHRPPEQSQFIRHEKDPTTPNYRSKQNKRIHHQNLRPPPIPIPHRGLKPDQRGILTPRRSYPGSNSNTPSTSSETSKTGKLHHYNKRQQQQKDREQHQYSPQNDNNDVLPERSSFESLEKQPSEQNQSNVNEPQPSDSLHYERTRSPRISDQREVPTPKLTNSRINRSTPPTWKETNQTEQRQHSNQQEPESTKQPRKDYRYRFYSGDDDGPVATAVTSHGLEEFFAYIAP